ncbi:hypothetical protein KIW84_035283 [Lathyrus oleraceus]|uniref:Uncharacterized protein n=1 Tax=Pisum sativum TaxID=3888 RepID=A0A9D5B6H4_PEA|nr:hypothetical protein KIW84_035283 [Pisum sativum]
MVSFLEQIPGQLKVDIVADKNCEKIHYMAPNIYCCGKGIAANTEAVMDMGQATSFDHTRVESLKTLLSRKTRLLQDPVDQRKSCREIYTRSSPSEEVTSRSLYKIQSIRGSHVEKSLQDPVDQRKSRREISTRSSRSGEVKSRNLYKIQSIRGSHVEKSLQDPVD